MIDKEIAQSADHTFSFQFYRNGLQIVPTSATITISDNGGAVKQTGSATIETDGDCTYTFLAANSGTVNANYKLKVSYVYGGLTFNQYHTFDIVKTPLVCTVSDDDLFAYIPELRDRAKERVTETSALGTTSTITCSDLKADTRDFTGGYMTLFVAPADDCDVTDTHDARVTAYDKTTGGITFSPAYTAAVASGTAVTLRPSYEAMVKRIWLDHVLRDVRAVVGYAAGYIDSNVVKLATICKALAVYCFSQSEEAGDKWERRATHYEGEYKAEIQRIQSAFDSDEDGNLSDSENNNRPSFSFRGFTR